MNSINFKYVNFLLKMLVVIYLIFSFLHWSFNPEKWCFISRIIAIAIFITYANLEKDNYN